MKYTCAQCSHSIIHALIFTKEAVCSVECAYEVRNRMLLQGWAQMGTVVESRIGGRYVSILRFGRNGKMQREFSVVTDGHLPLGLRGAYGARELRRGVIIKG